MAWPSLIEYSGAVQSPRVAFVPPDLKGATVLPNQWGLPKSAAGNFAVVYQARIGSDVWALRCFLRDTGDLGQRYEKVAAHLASTGLPYFVPCSYIPQGILVGGQTYPLVRMGWVRGESLNRYVESVLDQPFRLIELARAFLQLSADLERARIGHGDISSDNVLIQNGAIRLVDYDGMFVPALSGRNAREIGNAAFQHPGRTGAHFDHTIDRFSILVICTALASLVADPTIWDDFGTDNDGLLFTKADLANHGRSDLFRRIGQTRDPVLTRLRSQLARWCSADPADREALPALDAIGVQRLAPSARGPRRASASIPGSGTAAWWREHEAAGRSAHPLPVPGPAAQRLTPVPEFPQWNVFAASDGFAAALSWGAGLGFLLLLFGGVWQPIAFVLSAAVVLLLAGFAWGSAVFAVRVLRYHQSPNKASRIARGLGAVQPKPQPAPSVQPRQAGTIQVPAPPSAPSPRPGPPTTSTPRPSPKPRPAPAASGPVVASPHRDKFHRPSCKWALRIGRRKLTFPSAADARAAGYKACRECRP